MLETIATLLVGMGLLFYGMKLLGAETKQLGGRRLRVWMEKWTRHKIIGILFGFISGAITHSGGSASLIFTNLVSSGLIDIKNALLILAAANVGTVAIVFMFAINLKLGIMYLLGISAMVYSLNRRAAKFPLVRMILGISILLFGFHELEAGAEHLLEMQAFNGWLVSFQNYWYFYTALFVAGLILRLLTQSSSTVAVLVISLGVVGILNRTQILFMVAGAPLGAAVAMLFESKHVKGSTRQIPFFQIFYEVAGSLVFMMLVLLELATGWSGIKSWLAEWFGNVPEYVAVALLLIRLIPFIIVVAFHQKMADFLERIFPPITEETLANPQFLHDRAIDDPQTAMELVDKEVYRIMSRFPAYLENVRVEHDSPEFIDQEILHAATAKLGNYIALFIKDMFNQSLAQEDSERLLKIQNQHGLIMLMEENLYLMVNEIKGNEVPDDLNRLRTNIIESLHAVLATCMDCVDDTDYDMAFQQLIFMTSDKGSLMEKIRGKYLSDYEDPTGAIRKTMMYVTDLYQRIIWLVNKWAISY
jgi:phosphate:Na+ symporter